MARRDGAQQQRPLKPIPYCASSRLGISLICFLGFVNMYTVRFTTVPGNCDVINTTDTTNQSAVRNGMTSCLGSHICKLNVEVNETPILRSSNSAMAGAINKYGEEARRLLASSLLWGDVIGQLPTGVLAWKFGGKIVLCTCMFISALTTLLTPLAFETNKELAVTSRFIFGLSQGATWPAVQTLLARWSPPQESSKLAGLAYSGSQIGIIGSIVMTLFCTHWCQSHWPSLFYIQGNLSLLWVIVCIIMVTDTPSGNSRISGEEKEYITGSQRNRGSFPIQDGDTVPWRGMMTSYPLWGILVSHTCGAVGSHVYLSCISTFIQHSITDDKYKSVLQATPHLGLFVVIVLTGHIADHIRSTDYLSTTSTRKIFNSIGELTPAIVLIIAGVLPSSHPTVKLTLLVTGASLTGCVYSGGYIINAIDISPQYAGIVFGISNTLASAFVLLGSATIAESVHAGYQGNWEILVVVTATIYIFGSLFFLVFGSGSPQHWNTTPCPTHHDETREPDIANSAAKPATTPQIGGGTCASLHVDVIDEDART